MSSEEILVFIVPAIAFIITGAIAYFSGRARSTPVLTALGVIWAGFTGWMFFGMQQTTGWDGLGYAIALVLLAAPAAVGIGLGGLVGWVRSRKDIHA